MKRFVIDIRLGNDAMSSGADVAEQLRSIANIVESFDDGGLKRGLTNAIVDRNGNVVGRWAVKSSKEES